jgi:hypothetical protein
MRKRKRWRCTALGIAVCKITQARAKMCLKSRTEWDRTDYCRISQKELIAANALTDCRGQRA